jgi:hypothetical protein
LLEHHAGARDRGHGCSGSACRERLAKDSLKAFGSGHQVPDSNLTFPETGSRRRCMMQNLGATELFDGLWAVTCIRQEHAVSAQNPRSRGVGGLVRSGFAARKPYENRDRQSE